jgi:hypothetical protein
MSGTEPASPFTARARGASSEVERTGAEEIRDSTRVEAVLESEEKESTTEAPRETRCVAVAAPMPFVPPVMRAVLPARGVGEAIVLCPCVGLILSDRSRAYSCRDIKMTSRYGLVLSAIVLSAW